MKTLGLSKNQMVKGLVGKCRLFLEKAVETDDPIAKGEAITFEMIGTYISNSEIERYYRAIFVHSNANQVRVLIRHARENKEKNIRPNMRHGTGAPVARMRKHPGRWYRTPNTEDQMALVFLGELRHRVFGG